MSLKLKSGAGLASGSGLGMGLGHGYAYSVAAAALSIIGPMLLVAGGVFIVVGLAGLIRRRMKPKEAQA